MLSEVFSSLAFLRTPKSANGPRSNSFRPDSPFTTTSHGDGRLSHPPHHTGHGPFRTRPKLNVSVYGGPILNTWLDRPLSMAGKVCLRSPDPFHPEVLLVDFARPLLTVPNLAIHFNREVNKGVELNPQKDMQPLLAVLMRH